MKRLALLAAGLLLFSGCGRDQQPIKQPVKSTDAPKAPDSPDAPDAPGEPEPVFLGQPLSHWVGQAAAADGPEDREKTIEALMLAVKSETAAVRVKGADSLGLLNPKSGEVATALTPLLEDKNPWPRVAGMQTLQEMGTAAVPALIETLKTASVPGRIRAALVLGGIGPDAKDAIPLLKAAVEDESSAIHGLAAKILSQVDPKPADTAGAAKTKTPVVIEAESPILTTDATRDWPGFHGPNRDSICTEGGLMQSWPADGPKLLWKVEGLGRAYSTIAIAGGRIFTMGDLTPPGKPESQFVMALDLATREQLWITRVGPPHNDGPRSTPTVDGELVYVIGTEGDLLCLESATGKIRWQKNLAKEFDGRVMKVWKYSESPLIDGDRLLCTPGGPEACIVALDKKTGSLIWKSAQPEIGPGGADGAAYSSIVVAEICGVRQYVQMIGRGLVGVEAETGKFLWGYNRVANGVANITSPVVRGNYVFGTTAYGTGSALVGITRDGENFSAEEVYFLGPKKFENHHGGVVLVGDHIYGGSGSNKGKPVCLKFASGEIAWSPKAPQRGSASVLYADGHVIFRYDRGLVLLVEATPEEFRVKGRFKTLPGSGPGWPHPVIHDGKLFLRCNEQLLCYDLRGPDQPSK